MPGRILPKLEPIRDFMCFLVACKNEENPIKIEGARVVTILFTDFSDVQVQLTPKSVMESCRNSISSELLWLVLSSARIQKIHQKLKALGWHNISPIISLWGFFQTLKGR